MSALSVDHISVRIVINNTTNLYRGIKWLALTRQPYYWILWGGFTGVGCLSEPKEQFEYYCKSHKNLCCKSCYSTVYQHCLNVNENFKEVSFNKVAIPEVDSQIQKVRIKTHEAGKLLEKTDDTSDQLDSIISHIDSQKATITKRFDELKVTVTRQFKTAEERLGLETVSLAATIQSIADDIDAKAILLQPVQKNDSPE